VPAGSSWPWGCARTIDVPLREEEKVVLLKSVEEIKDGLDGGKHSMRRTMSQV
jgi:hypothetical protein